MKAPASRRKSAGAPRRAFLRDLGVVALGFATARPAWGGPPDISHWEIVRDVVGSGVIGAVRNADVTLPKSVRNTAWSRRCDRFGASLPVPVSDALDGLLPAMAAHPATIRAAEHHGSFAVTCLLGDGSSVAIASAPANSEFRATVRGTKGSLHILDKVISVEANGCWRKVRG